MVNRIVDGEGRAWLGRLVFPDHLAALYAKLGLDGPGDPTPDDVAQSVLAGRTVTLTRPFALTVKRSLVNGAQRIELVGCPAGQLAWLKSLGCFTEIIQYRTRVFAPVAGAQAVFAALAAGG